MRLIILLVLNLFAASTLYSQIVSINTDSYLANTTFHIDAKGDNTVSLNEDETLNDIVISNTGKVGVGTISPAASLDVRQTSGKPLLLIKDGSQAMDRALTSDSYGNGSWQTLDFATVRMFEIKNEVSSFKVSDVSNNYMYTKIQLSLPPGRWLVDCRILVAKDLGMSAANISNYELRAWVKTTFSDSPLVVSPSADILQNTIHYISGFLYGVSPGYNILNGFMVINNPTSNQKNYYYCLVIDEIYGLPSDLVYNIGGSTNSIMSYISARYVGM